MTRTRGKKKQVKTRSKVGRKKVRGGKRTTNDPMYYTSAALLGGNALVDLLKTGFDGLKHFLHREKEPVIEKLGGFKHLIQDIARNVSGNKNEWKKWSPSTMPIWSPGTLTRTLNDYNKLYGGMLPGWKGYHPRGYKHSEAQADLEKIKQYYSALESM